MIVIERRPRTGGILDGVVDTVGGLRPEIAAELDLERHGLQLIRPRVRMLALSDAAAPVTFWADPQATREELGALSREDADAYIRFDRHLRTLGSFMAELGAAAPPRLDRPTLRDAAGPGLRLGRAYRALGPRAARELTRALPMAAADLVGEWFSADALRGPIAHRGTRFTAMGPWSAGTGAVLLADSAAPDAGAAGETVFARGGPQALAAALEASAARRRRRGAHRHGGRAGADRERPRQRRGARLGRGAGCAGGRRPASTRRRCSRAGSTRW